MYVHDDSELCGSRMDVQLEALPLRCSYFSVISTAARDRWWDYV